MKCDRKDTALVTEPQTDQCDSNNCTFRKAALENCDVCGQF